MQTLVHEDIYVYVDKLKESTVKKVIENEVTFVNDAIENICDKGIVNITVKEGGYSNFIIRNSYNEIACSMPLPENSHIVLNLRDNVFKLNDGHFFLSELPVLNDNEYNTLTFLFAGTGLLEVEYSYLKPDVSYNDVYFVESFDLSQKNEIITKKNIFGETSYVNSDNKTYSFNTNGLWNNKELEKFDLDEKFRIRLVDEEGNKLDTLCNCTINELSKSSSDSSDYKYSLSGQCEKIF